MQNFKLFKYHIFLILILWATISCSKKTAKSISDQDATEINKDSYTNNIDSFLIKTEMIPTLKYTFDFDKLPTISEIFDKAAQKNKLIFVDIHAKWCAPCKLMQRDVYTHDATGNYFNEHFINYMIDIDSAEGPDLKLIYDVNVIPTLLWLDSKGRVIHKKEGACYHLDLITNAEIAIKKASNK